jgi:hypothetical protein
MKLIWMMISFMILFSCGLYESEGRYLFEEDFSKGKIQIEEASTLYDKVQNFDCGGLRYSEAFWESCELKQTPHNSTAEECQYVE